MRDPGLSEAIRAAGGVSELARQLGISQPSVSNWMRVPAERVISVEVATGVNRAVLRPDLYGAQKTGGNIDEVDAARLAQRVELAREFPNCAPTPRHSALRMRHSPKLRNEPILSVSNGNFLICSSAWAAVSYCRTAHII